MIKVCIYCNRKYPDGNVTFHKFPSDKERRKKWLSAMKIPNEVIDKNSYLCSEHFESDTYSCQVVNKVTHRFLHLYAVPSIFNEKDRISIENQTESMKQVKKPKENQNNSIQIVKQCTVESEDCYYYKIENGLIHRYLREGFKHPVSSPVSNANHQNVSIEVKENDEGNSNKKSFEELQRNIAHVEAPVKVERLPDFQLPIEMHDAEVFSKENVSNFKNDEPKIIFEDMKMDAEEIPFEQIDQYSYLNGINEIEISSCEPEPLEIQQMETPVSEETVVVTGGVKINTNNVIVNVQEFIGKKQFSNDAKIQKPLPLKLNSWRKRQIGEGYENKAMKALLYKYLEDRNSNKMDKRLKRYNKQKLSDLLKTAFNYIDSLEEKVKIITEKNNDYALRISEFENLRQSISDSETSKTNSV